MEFLTAEYDFQYFQNEQCQGVTLQGTNISSQKLHFEDDFPFPQMGYVNPLEGNSCFPPKKNSKEKFAWDRGAFMVDFFSLSLEGQVDDLKAIPGKTWMGR